MYDYLVVGAGLYGVTFAHEAKKAEKKVLVLEKRKHIAGNVYTDRVNGINVHKYGAHIFHTNDEKVWNYVNQFAEFNSYSHSPVANYKGKLYHLPFNMNTFCEMWGDITPEKVKEKLEESKIPQPSNLEEKAISMVGEEIYQKLVKGYTEKQWGRPLNELPPFIISRIPLRFTFDNNYFDARYQGIPVGGYTMMAEKMLKGIEVKTETDYFKNKAKWDAMTKKVVYTGPIDRYFEYVYGTLSYRTVSFKQQVLEEDDYQHNAVVNYTDKEIPWTRIIEHKWFEDGRNEQGEKIKGTVISYEYSKEWQKGEEPYYPINDEKNNALYEKYQELAKRDKKVIFGGRLGEYRYYDMDMVIKAALERWEKENEQ